MDELYSPRALIRTAVAPGILRLLPKIFTDPMGTIKLDPSYEYTTPVAEPERRRGRATDPGRVRLPIIVLGALRAYFST